jgi:hypothetical protein
MIRSRISKVCLAILAMASSVGVAGVAGASAPAAAVVASGPHCTFNGSALPIVTGASAGQKVTISCTGLPPLHPYLVMETSLLLGIDPKAAPLLSGNLVSLPGLLSLLSSLPEINPAALTFPLSDLSGNLNLAYTLPTSHALDPNAVCPPTTAQINDGLIGCGLATIDLTSFKPVGAGSAVIEYAGDPLFPPAPTLALSAATANRGQAVTVSDATGAGTHWWLSTLVALESLLGGGTPPLPTVTVTLTKGTSILTAPNTITVSPAVYNNPVLTPPKISGTFTVPTKKSRGKRMVTVTYQVQLLGINLANSATAPLKVR